MPRTLHTEIWLPRPRDEVFAFFSDAFNLDELTPPWLQFKVLTPAPIAMRQGTLIDYRIKIHGVPVRWRTEIAVWEPPHRFVDQQLRGPYRLWRHEHAFISERGGTRVVDHVDYQAKVALVEPLLYRLFVRRDVERIFAYREQRLRARFATDAQVRDGKAPATLAV